MSIYLPIALSILIATGWLSFLSTELAVSRSMLLFWLSLISCLSFLPPLTIATTYDIHLNYIVLLGLWLFFLSRIPINRLFTIVSLMLMLGSILFLYHEVSQVQLIWKSSHFQWFTVLFASAEAVLASSCFIERICLVFGGLSVAQGGILFLYHDQLSPIVFPVEGFLHTFWLTLISLGFIHGILAATPSWLKDWGLVLWTKKR
jgi:hypothetical protein